MSTSRDRGTADTTGPEAFHHFLNSTVHSQMNRRQFIKAGTVASLGLATGGVFAPGPLLAAPSSISRVVVVMDDDAVIGQSIQSDIVRIMVDAGVKALTDAPTSSEAWRTIFPSLAPDLGIGIKINTLNTLHATHPEVTIPVVESLAATQLAMGSYPINQMVIWDRWDWELEAAGYTINTSSTGVRCFATNHPGVGYDTGTVVVNGVHRRVSRCFSDHSDRLINLCLLRNHTISGITGALKSHYGSVDYPESLHPTHCDPYIPALNGALISRYGPRQSLCMCDAMFGIRYGGPTGPPQIVPKSLLLSFDPVAMDATLREVLREYGSNTIGLASHVDTASSDPYNLGTSALDNIERVDIINPSVPVSSGRRQGAPECVSLGGAYPQPFTTRTTIPITMDRTLNVRLEVVNMAGQRVKRLYLGSLSAGTHRFSWDAMYDNGADAPSGRYVVRLATPRKTHSRTITLIR